jgi:CRP/FNR family transcriptional regulator, cyclic AMP receptor protein
MSSQRSVISLLEADPEFGEALAGDERALASRALMVHARVLEVGPWEPSGEFVGEPPAVGLLLLDGILTRDLVFAGRTTTELVGGGDVVRPWDDDPQLDALPFSASWHVHVPSHVALLDARFALACGRWPALASALGARHVRRARGLAFQRAIAQLPRIDDRLLVLLWALAERWGRVGPHGVRLPLPLTHRTLATLVGARRPSVTTALSGLSREGLVERTPDGWLLHGDAADILPRRLDPDARAIAS